MKTIIENKVKQKFLEELERVCIEYKLIGSGVESPKWLQYRCNFVKLENEKTIIYFNNSQNGIIYIAIDLERLFKGKELEEAKKMFHPLCSRGDYYDFFRDIKYDYINKNHPTINGGLR